METQVNPIQVQKYLAGVDYPASKDELIKRAKQQGADDNVLNTLESLNEDDFNSPNEVSEAIGNNDKKDKNKGSKNGNRGGSDMDDDSGRDSGGMNR